jgi:hypothetical protein
MWLSFSVLLYALVQPLTWRNGRSTPVLDVAALLDAASLAAVVHLTCWLLLFPLAWNARPAKAALWGISTAWFASSAIFLWIEGAGRDFIDHYWLTERTTEIMADGQDIAFMPIVIPALSIVAATLFAGVIWLSNRRINRYGINFQTRKRGLFQDQPPLDRNRLAFLPDGRVCGKMKG